LRRCESGSPWRFSVALALALAPFWRARVLDRNQWGGVDAAGALAAASQTTTTTPTTTTRRRRAVTVPNPTTDSGSGGISTPMRSDSGVVVLLVIGGLARFIVRDARARVPARANARDRQLKGTVKPIEHRVKRATLEGECAPGAHGVPSAERERPQH